MTEANIKMFYNDLVSCQFIRELDVDVLMVARFGEARKVRALIIIEGSSGFPPL